MKSTTLYVFSVIAISLALWMFAWSTQSYFLGEPPTKTYDEYRASNPLFQGTSDVEVSGHPDDGLAAYRAEVQNNPDSLQAWLELAGAARQNASQATDATLRSLYLQTVIRSYLKVVTLDPETPAHRLELAETFFALQQFPQAVEEYRRYLQQEPTDSVALYRLASALNLLGRAEEALAIAQQLRKSEGESFRILALESISLASLGNRAGAAEVARAAMEQAPTPESRARFAQFLESLEQKPDEQQGPSTEGIVASYLTAHPMVGEKLIKVEEDENSAELVITLENFPMQAMPPFARQKFLSSLWGQVGGSSSIRTLRFIDFSTGETMYRESKDDN